MSSVSAKSLIAPPPQMKRTVTVINVVSDVSNVRLNVWLILVLIMPSVRLGLLPRTSRIRSKTTIVSFNE